MPRDERIDSGPYACVDKDGLCVKKISRKGVTLGQNVTDHHATHSMVFPR